MPDATNASPRERLSEGIKKLWWIPLVRGILLLVLGCYAICRPGMTALALTQVVGIFVIAEGILAIVAAILGQTSSRVWTFVRGVLAILIGIFVFAHPLAVAGITATIVLYVIAFGIIACGVLEIAAAIRDRKEIEGEGWLLLGGGLAVLFGVLLLIAPVAFGLLIVRVIGAFAILSGIAMIALAFRVRKFGKALNQ
jgi:uncharacterized membrane protein HdeD (DUF308 family)